MIVKRIRCLIINVKENRKSMENSNETENRDGAGESSHEDVFKKPLLVGKIGKLPKKISSQKDNEQRNVVDEPKSQNAVSDGNNLPLPYQEPPWGGLPTSMEKDYKIEVLKNGSIIDTVDLMSRSYWVFGRLNSCNICMQHPTISRYHVVLQYRREASESDQAGFYVYDLGSTHGTFLNKHRLKPRTYTRIQVGHMLKLGCSTRCFILVGPEYDEEDESELTVTELKQKKLDEALKLKEMQHLEVTRKLKEEERGIDWGLGDDAEEETDLSENPYAQTNNENLYVDDPKKALRGFFEREGMDLEYDCSEQGMGQFLCKVELPLDDESGRPIVAEVLHKGKKKEAVIQCALEACRILDRYGVLRQATHESRKRKAKNWEENDYYDSDEDTFLDRTGTIEKKRQQRMKVKIPQKAETYESLLEKEKNIAEEISNLESLLRASQKEHEAAQELTTEEDPLDNYMRQLSESKPDKKKITKIKLDLTKLKSEHAKIIRLVNIAKPAELPPLVPQYTSEESGTENSIKSGSFASFGKRKKIKVEVKPSTMVSGEVDDGIDEEEAVKVEKRDESSSEDEDEFKNLNNVGVSEFRETKTFKKFEEMVKVGLPSSISKHQDKLEKIIEKFKKIASNEDRLRVDWKMLHAKKRKIINLISTYTSHPDDKIEHKLSVELTRMLTELNEITEQKFKVLGQVKKIGSEIRALSEAMHEELEMIDKNDDCDEKKKKKNQRRINQRQEKAEIVKIKGYEEDASKEGYDMWVPPDDQTGDGRTVLNDRLGY